MIVWALAIHLKLNELVAALRGESPLDRRRSVVRAGALDAAKTLFHADETNRRTRRRSDTLTR
jgi:hypothetical protein